MGLQRTRSRVVDDGTGPGGYEHVAGAGCGSQNLEGPDHVQCGEPGVEQVDDLHLFSVGPHRADRQDRLLTISATASQAYGQPMGSR